MLAGEKKMKPLVEMKGITKYFGDFLANDHIDFVCYPGEVISLLGENGAGKTTLMNALYGMHRVDEGGFYFRDKLVSITNPKDAIALGIQMVHQHFMLIPTLTAADNIVLGRENCRHGIYQKKEANEVVRKLCEEYGLELNPQTYVRDLSVGGQQRVEILKALYRGAELLILDEPTAVLTPQESQELFATVKKLRAAGKSVIMITHKLKETMEFSDRVYILRGGKMTGTYKTSETTPETLTELMVGHRLDGVQRSKAPAGDVVLEMKQVSYTDKDHVSRLKDLSFSVRSGEIYGIAGVEGNGQKELIDILSGLEQGWNGRIQAFGESLAGLTPRQIMDRGISFVHADRHKRGLVLSFPLNKNFLLGKQRNAAFRKGKFIRFLDWKAVDSHGRKMIEEYDIRPDDISARANGLSGGNQQKVVIAREFSRGSRLIVISNPTRGVDIGASLQIHQKMMMMREQGAAIVLISADLDEILELSDRIGVIYEGTIAAECCSGEMTEQEIGSYMGGNAT